MVFCLVSSHSIDQLSQFPETKRDVQYVLHVLHFLNSMFIFAKQMSIRNATQNDLPDILEIFNYEIVHTPYVYLFEPWTLDYITHWFEEKKANNLPFLVYELDGKIAGYATYGKFRERAAYDTTVEYSVYLHKDYRGKGLAYKLVDELIRIAREQNYHVMIGGLDAANHDSIRFHKNMGFVEVAHLKSVARKFDTWRDLIFYQLILN